MERHEAPLLRFARFDQSHELEAKVAFEKRFEGVTDEELRGIVAHDEKRRGSDGGRVGRGDRRPLAIEPARDLGLEEKGVTQRQGRGVLESEKVERRIGPERIKRAAEEAGHHHRGIDGVVGKNRIDGAVDDVRALRIDSVMLEHSKRVLPHRRARLPERNTCTIEIGYGHNARAATHDYMQELGEERRQDANTIRRKRACFDDREVGAPIGEKLQVVERASRLHDLDRPSHRLFEVS